jgi:hypothetical protein
LHPFCGTWRFQDVHSRRISLKRGVGERINNGIGIGHLHFLSVATDTDEPGDLEIPYMTIRPLYRDNIGIYRVTMIGDIDSGRYEHSSSENLRARKVMPSVSRGGKDLQIADIEQNLPLLWKMIAACGMLAMEVNATF